jgi:hypothetical protein
MRGFELDYGSHHVWKHASIESRGYSSRICWSRNLDNRLFSKEHCKTQQSGRIQVDPTLCIFFLSNSRSAKGQVRLARMARSGIFSFWDGTKSGLLLRARQSFIVAKREKPLLHCFEAHEAILAPLGPNRSGPSFVVATQKVVKSVLMKSRHES